MDDPFEEDPEKVKNRMWWLDLGYSIPFYLLAAIIWFSWSIFTLKLMAYLSLKYVYNYKDWKYKKQMTQIIIFGVNALICFIIWEYFYYQINTEHRWYLAILGVGLFNALWSANFFKISPKLVKVFSWIFWLGQGVIYVCWFGMMQAETYGIRGRLDDIRLKAAGLS